MKTKYLNSKGLLLAVLLVVGSMVLTNCNDDDGPSDIPPSNVQNFLAQPRNMQVRLSWDRVIDLDLSEYRVTITPGNQIATADAEATELLISDLTNDTEYTFSIVAVNEAGLESEQAATATATPSVDAAIIPGSFAIDFSGETERWVVQEDSTFILRAPSGANDVAISWSASVNAATYSILGKYIADTTAAYIEDWEVIQEGIMETSTTVDQDDVSMPGVIYWFKVVAVSEDGSETDSDPNTDAAATGYAYLLTRGRPGAAVSTPDGDSYGTVQVGDLLWMDRNLNYDVDIDDFEAGPQDLDHPFKMYADTALNDTEAVMKSGRLYSYDAAIAAADEVPDFEVPSDLDLILFEMRLGVPRSQNLTAPRRERGPYTIYETVVKSENGWWNDHNRDTEFGPDEDLYGGENYLGLDFFPGGMSSVNRFTGAYFGWLMMMTSTVYQEEYRGQADQEMIYCHLTWSWNGGEENGPSPGERLRGVHRDRHPVNGITWEPDNPNGRAQRASVRLVSRVQ